MEIVIKTRVTGPYALEVTFSDGLKREVDLEAELTGEAFEPLRGTLVSLPGRR